MVARITATELVGTTNGGTGVGTLAGNAVAVEARARRNASPGPRLTQQRTR